MMRSLHFLFITFLVLLFISCSSQSETPQLEEFIVGKWEGRNEPNASYPDTTIANKPHSMEFLPGGRILWDMTTKDKTLRLAGDYKFIDNNTIQVDFVRYSTGTAMWDIACTNRFLPQDSITIRDSSTDDVVATMARVY